MDRIPKWLIQTFAVLATILMLALIVNQVYAVRNSLNSFNDKHTINISAEGKVTATPDLLTISISVVSKGSTAQAAQSGVTTKNANIETFVRTQGIADKDITTSDYSVYPNYNYDNGKNTIVDYSAGQTLTIKVRDTKNVSAILDGVTQHGADQITGVNYSFADIDSVKEQAREVALQNAKDKAEKLANAAGVKLGRLVSFTENSDTSVVPPIMYDKAAMGGLGGSGAAPVPQIDPGTQDINAQISVTYEIK